MSPSKRLTRAARLLSDDGGHAFSRVVPPSPHFSSVRLRSQWPTSKRRSQHTTRQAFQRRRSRNGPSTPSPQRTSPWRVGTNLACGGIGIDPFVAILNDSQPTPTPEHAALPRHRPAMAASNQPAVAVPQTLPSMPSMSFEPPPPALQVKLLGETAKPPTRGSAFAAGYDLYASRPATIPARGKALVDTDISIAVPANTYGRIAPRSGLASKHGIDTGAGVIDADYRGPVKVLLFNFSDVDFGVEPGERVAQLILERIVTPEVTVVAELEETVRGAGGFGSTGGFGGVLPLMNVPGPR